MKLNKLLEAFSPREKQIFEIFLWSLILLWAVGLNRRWAELNEERYGIDSKLELQDFHLKQVDDIDRRLATALKEIERGKLLDQGRLLGQMGILTGQRPNWKGKVMISRRESVVENLFKRHIVRVRIKRAFLSDLMAFDELIQGEAPYIAIESVAIEPDKRDPRLHYAYYDVSSFEFVEQAVQEG